MIELLDTRENEIPPYNTVKDQKTKRAYLIANWRTAILWRVNDLAAEPLNDETKSQFLQEIDVRLSNIIDFENYEKSVQCLAGFAKDFLEGDQV